MYTDLTSVPSIEGLFSWLFVDSYSRKQTIIENLLFLQDLVANPKCSLLVAKDPEDRTDLIITLLGDVVPVSPPPFQILDTFFCTRK